MTQSEYTASSIQILEGLEAVRKRPGMYCGDTGKRGMHHLVWEIMDNAVDEINAGHGDKITLTLDKKLNIVSIEDNGRGIPTGIHPKLGISTIQVVFTKLHAGGKFDQGAYKTAGGLHGVGSAVTNALSSSLSVEVWRDKEFHTQLYSEGKLRLANHGKSPEGQRTKTGTVVTFTPDRKIFGKVKFDFETICERAKTKAYINSGLTIICKTTCGEKEVFSFQDGLLDYLHDYIQGSPIIPPIRIQTDTVEVSMVWSEEITAQATPASFANGILTPNGGTHAIGLDKAIIDAVRGCCGKLGIWGKKTKIVPSDVREGLFVAVSIFLQDPQFQSQTKDRLNNKEAQKEVYDTVKPYLEELFTKDKPLLGIIARRIESAMRARLVSRQASEAIKRQSVVSKLKLPGKLSDCSSTDLAKTELFIVEGDSAGGSAKQGRDRNTQAILPLRGKVLNCESATLKRVLDNNEISDLIQAIGTGILERFDIGRLRYGKIIIMTDADSDGHHIACLLMAFFYRFMPDLIDAGCVYLAKPPLYKIETSKKTHWAFDDRDKISIVKKIGKTKHELTRFKGLGEMPAKVLFETTMNPKSRQLERIVVPDEEEADYWLSTLMGKDVEERANIITAFASDLDAFDL